MDMAEFGQLVDKAVAGIPAKFRRILKKEGIRLWPREEMPAALKKQERGGVVFGIFIGVPYNERSVFNAGDEPTRIELYKNSFERAFSHPDEIEEQIHKTVVHEIGHYFGFSESELRQKGL